MRPFGFLIAISLVLSACASDTDSPFDANADREAPSLVSMTLTEMDGSVYVSWRASEPVQTVIEYDNDGAGTWHSSYLSTRRSFGEEGVTELLALLPTTSYTNLRIRMTDRAGNEASVDAETPDFTTSASLSAAPLFFIAMIDVGWGDSFYLEAPDGTNCLIDAGHPQDGLVVRDFLENRMGVTSLDFASMTHVHNDHIGGFYGDGFDDLDGLFEDQGGGNPPFPVGTFLDIANKTPGTETNGPYRSLRGALDGLGSSLGQLVMLETGASSDTHQALRWGAGVRVDLLAAGRKPFLLPDHIYQAEAGSVENNDSMIYRVQYGEFVILLMGDGEFASEQFLQNRWPLEFLRATVHKLGHHGSNDSNSERFIDIVDPVVALISNRISENPGVEHPFVLGRLRNRGTDYFASDRAEANLARSASGIRANILLYTDGATFTVVADNIRFE